MKKTKLLTALLWISIGCITNMSIAVATSVQPKPVQKKSVDSHKKNKSVQTHKITEKDITECTQLINKVTQIDRVSQKEMTATAANTTKIAEHLKKSADVQLFASDDPIAIAHLTGKNVNLSVAPAPVGQIAKVTKITPSVTIPPKPIAKLTVPPVAKQVVKVSPQVFSSDTPQKIIAQDAKTNLAAVTPPKSVAPKSAKPATSQPHIELFAPNTPVDLDHLEGGSASLDTVQKTAPVNVNKPAKVQQKTNKPTPTSKKPSSTAAATTKVKKGHS